MLIGYAIFMNQRITVSFNGNKAYDIMIEANFAGLTEKIKTLDMAGRRFMVISDSNVSRLYLKECITYLSTVAREVTYYTFPAGENSKNLDTVSECYGKLIAAGFDRNDVLVALGGGVVGDITGFAAATYLRGIRFIQIPTSLLAMVDSSIGGKTGVDYKAYKNMVGAFHQPALVYINIATLNTLGSREFNSGMSEIIKHGLIKDCTYYHWLLSNADGILAKDYDTLTEMIKVSCRIKSLVVELDPKEKGDRALLNYGHTIGHAVEKLMDFTLLHGECVAIGMAGAAYISLLRGYITKEEYQGIFNTLQVYQQPVAIHGLDIYDILEAAKHDKKKDSDRIKFILLRAIGQAVIDSSVSYEEMAKAINSLRQ